MSRSLLAVAATTWGLALVLSVVTACAVLEAKSPAERAVELIRAADTARDAAAQGCALYRAGVLLGEIQPDPTVTAACDEAFPVAKVVSR